MAKKVFLRTKQKHKGFTLLEVIIAIFILVTGTAAAFSLVQQTLSFTSSIKGKFTASYLGQEGIEITKSLRDKAWLEQRSSPAVTWDAYLPTGDWQADYLSQSLTQPYNDSAYLNIDSNGFYSYLPGSPTAFKRKISISNKTDLNGDDKPDVLTVSVEVKWQEKGRWRKFDLVEYLTNWNQ